MPTSLILVDSREQKPLAFPSTIRANSKLYTLRSSVTTLPTADYHLSVPKPRVLIERKSGWGELASNLLSADKARFSRCLDRLAEAPYPLLFLEQPLTPPRPNKGVRNPPSIEELYSLLLAQLAPRGIHFLPAPTSNRLRNAALLAQIMLTHQESPE